MATLGELTTFISEKLMDDSNTAVPATRVKRAINDAVKYWKRRSLWFNEFEETITISEATPAFSLSTNTPLYLFKDGGVVINYSSQRYPLTKVSSEYYDQINVQQSGRPFAWTYRNDGFESYFYADQDYSAICRGIKDYSALATDGADDSQTNDWLTEAETLIEHEALARLHIEYRQDTAMGQLYAQSARDEYQILQELQGSKVKTGTAQIHSCLI